jgi:hypothetical protein
MRGGFAFSVGFHTLILLLLLFGLPFLHVKPRELPPMISVELVDMGKETTTNKISAANKVEKEPQPETPPPPPKPQTATQPDPAPPEPEPPKPRVALEETAPKLASVSDSVPELKTPDVNLKKQLPPAPELAKVDAKVADLAAPTKVDLKRPEPKKPTESFDAVLKNLTKNVPQPPTTEPPSPQSKTPAKASGALASLSDKLTVSEMDALGQQLRHCWSLPAAAKDAQNLVVDLDLVVNPDRTVASVQVVDQARMASDPAFRTAAQSAMRALRMPQCTPLALPPEKYQEWQSMTLHFDPKEMLGQ